MRIPWGGLLSGKQRHSHTGTVLPHVSQEVHDTVAVVAEQPQVIEIHERFTCCIAVVVVMAMQLFRTSAVICFANLTGEVMLPSQFSLCRPPFLRIAKFDELGRAAAFPLLEIILHAVQCCPV